MSQSALAALLGSKPSQTPKPTSAPVATPAAQPAASAPPPATTAPAPVAAPSAPSPSPAAAPSAATAPAVPSPAAAPTAVAPGPNAAAVATPQGAPPDTLAALLGDFKANVGKAPQVNPPQAAAVLAGPAAKEVAGHPEPPPEPETKVAPVAKPPEVVAAENATKTRRTAAVVQVELDAALKRVAELEAAVLAASQQVVEQATSNVIGAGDVGVLAEKDATIAEAVELIQQLRGEAGIQLEDNRKAWARVAELEEQLAAAGAGASIQLLGQIDFLLLAGELQSRLDGGQTFTVAGLPS